MILVDDVALVIDVSSWMIESKRFDSIKATARDWIQATCPFHNDDHPSFAVNAETGVFRCQACGAAGGFVKLVKHVEGHATLLDAEQSLLQRFGRFVPSTDEPLTLNFDDREEETFVSVETLIQSSADTLTYIVRRGINGAMISRFTIGWNIAERAITIPWFDAKGRCVTVKKRSVEDKRFWYDPPISAGRLKRLLYGFHLAKDSPLIVVTEGEIDAMSVVQAGLGSPEGTRGIAAVALGGASISAQQASLLRNCVADEIVVFTDNDEAGRKVRGKIVDALIGHKRVSVVDWSWYPFSKDANDVLRRNGENGMRDIIENRVHCPLPLTFE